MRGHCPLLASYKTKTWRPTVSFKTLFFFCHRPAECTLETNEQKPPMMLIKLGCNDRCKRDDDQKSNGQQFDDPPRLIQLQTPYPSTIEYYFEEYSVTTRRRRRLTVRAVIRSAKLNSGQDFSVESGNVSVKRCVLTILAGDFLSFLAGNGACAASAAASGIRAIRLGSLI